MSSDDSSNSKEFQECILKCKDSKRFYCLPTKLAMRKVWLEKLGLLDDGYCPSTNVCDRHFSAKMMESDKQLKAIASPDMNIPTIIAPSQKCTTVTKNSLYRSNATSQHIETQNEAQNLLVDYQLRVRGKHLCDVIEIPQYIVVFTVVKAKQKRIQLTDIQVKNLNTLNHSNLTSFFEDTDDGDDTRSTPEILPLIPRETRETKPPKTEKSEHPIIYPQNSEPEPLIDIVYYSTENAIPRRDRAVQVDLSNKRNETGIQCDFQLDNDIIKISSNTEENLLDSRLRIDNLQPDMDECLVCGEIVSCRYSKIRHARNHNLTQSLCCQCGKMFNSRQELRTHEKAFHSKNQSSQKPHRCPKIKCTKAFLSIKLLNNHIKEHIQTKQHKCHKCLQHFSSSIKLICHQRALDKCLRLRGWTSRRWSKRI